MYNINSTLTEIDTAVNFGSMSATALVAVAQGNIEILFVFKNHSYLKLLLIMQLRFPIKAHSIGIQLLRLLFCFATACYTITFSVDGYYLRIPRAILSVSLTHLWFLPIFLKCWIIFFTYMLNDLRLQAAAVDTQTQQAILIRVRVATIRFLLSKTFVVFVMVVDSIVYMVQLSLAMTLSMVFASVDDYGIIAAPAMLAITIVNLILGVLVIAALIIGIIRIGVKENYGIIRLLIFTVICSCINLAALATFLTYYLIQRQNYFAYQPLMLIIVSEPLM